MWNTIRKFGLEYCDFPTMLWNVSTMLRTLTLNIDSRYKESVPIFFYFLTAVTAACYFYVYLVSMAWFVFCKCQETGDVFAALVVFSLGVTSEMGTLKLLNMFLYRDIVKSLVDGYLACDALVVPGSRFSSNLLKSLRAVKIRAMAFWIVIISNGVVYIAKPIVTPGRHHMEDMFILYGFEPQFESPNYEIVFLIMAAGVYFTVYLPANITAFLIVITGYTESQMLALSEELTCLWDDANKHYTESSTGTDIPLEIETEANSHEDHQINNKIKDKILNDYVEKRLEEIVNIHRMHINFVHQIETVFRGAIGIEFMLLIVGLIAELLGGLENTWIEMPFALMQVGMDCLTGQRLMDASIVFENAVYDCKWENFNVKNMKSVLLILTNSQKTMTLSAGGITMLTFSCFMSVIRSIYSAYTTLRTTMN